jgi:hypothetical protein
MQSTAQSEIVAIDKYKIVIIQYLVSKVSLDKPKWLFLIPVSPVSPLKIQELHHKNANIKPYNIKILLSYHSSPPVVHPYHSAPHAGGKWI